MIRWVLVAQVDWTGIGSLSALVSALGGVIYSIYKARKAAPKTAMDVAVSLINELQEDNDRLRNHVRSCGERLRAAEEEIWTIKAENWNLQQRISSLEATQRKRSRS